MCRVVTLGLALPAFERASPEAQKHKKTDKKTQNKNKETQRHVYKYKFSKYKHKRYTAEKIQNTLIQNK